MQLWTECGIANGIATLGADAKITPAQLSLVAADLPTSIGKWTKYAVTMVGGNLLVNGVIVAAKAAATSQSLALFTKAVNTVVEKVILKHGTAFVGASITALTASVGISGTLTGMTATLDMVPAVSATNFVENALAPTLTLASVGVVLSLIATGANLSVLSAGAVDVWVKTSVLP